MKFKDAMNGPDSNKWKENIKNEHKIMVINRVWELLDKKGFTRWSKGHNINVGM